MIKIKFSKLAFAGILTSMLAVTQIVSVHASNTNSIVNKPIYFNEDAITFSVIEQNGYQLVPATLFRQLGVEVTWNEQQRSPKLSNQSMELLLPIGERSAYYKQAGDTATNKDVSLYTRTMLIEGQSYVPLAYTASKLGIKVEYDPLVRAARVHTEHKVEPQPQFQMLNVSSVSADEMYWLNQLVEAEAGGESFEGKLAVASVVLNRMKAEGWPNSIKDIIFEVVYVNGKSYYQFEPVLNKYIYEVNPSEDTRKAVQAAIEGDDPTNGAVVFYNPEKTSNKWILSRPIVKSIGNHVFAH